MEIRRTCTAALLAIAILLLAACGLKTEDVATLRSAGGQQAAPTAQAEAMDDEAKVMAFAQCLRDHGLEVLDPIVDADGTVQKPELAEGADISKEAWIEAFEECGKLLEGVTWGEKRVDRSADVDRWLEIARCLGEKGYDVGEPTAEDIDTWLGEIKSQLDWKDADVTRAWEDCAEESAKGNGQEK